MAAKLKTVLSFVAVPAAGSAVLPHGLTDGVKALVPDEIKPSIGGLTWTADATNVTATNPTAAAITADVLCEAWHSIERSFGSSATVALSPQPFVGVGGNGNSESVVIYPEIRLMDPGAANRPSVVSAGATLGYVFAISNQCFFEVPLEPGLDRTQDMTIRVSWAPTGSEVGKTVSWQLNVLPLGTGDNVAAAGTPLQAVDEAVPAVAATYASSAFIVPAALFAAASLFELHCRVSRIASTSDPVASPGVHHISVTQVIA